MKKFISFCFLCILAFACSPVMATGFSPGNFQKHAVEKTALQASPAIVAILVNAEIAAPAKVSVFKTNKNEIFKTTNINQVVKTNCSTAWRDPERNHLNFKNQLLPETSSNLAERIPVKIFTSNLQHQNKLTYRLIPYSRDRS